MIPYRAKNQPLEIEVLLLERENIFEAIEGQ